MALIRLPTFQFRHDFARNESFVFTNVFVRYQWKIAFHQYWKLRRISRNIYTKHM